MASNFFKRFILETIDDMTDASRKFGEKIGIQPLIDTRSYSLQAATYYALFVNLIRFSNLQPRNDPPQRWISSHVITNPNQTRFFWEMRFGITQIVNHIFWQKVSCIPTL